MHQVSINHSVTVHKLSTVVPNAPISLYNRSIESEGTLYNIFGTNPAQLYLDVPVDKVHTIHTQRCMVRYNKRVNNEVNLETKLNR